MVLRLPRLLAGVCLVVMFFLAGCSSTKIPTAVVETETVATLVPTQPGASPEVAQKGETVTPSKLAQEGGAETAYTGPNPQIVQGSGAGNAYPAPGSNQPSAQVNSSQSAPGTDAYPAPETTEQVQRSASSSAYPAPGSEAQQPLASSNTPYPGPQTDTPATPQSETPAPSRASQTPTPLISVPTTTPTPRVSFTAVPTETPVATSTPMPTEVDPNFHPTTPSTVRLDSGRVQLVEFFTYWCGDCRAMAPLVHSLEAQYQDRMNFIYLDTDNPATLELKKALGYRDQPDNPQFFLLDASGKIIKKWVGVVSEEEFRKSFEAALMK